MKNLNNKPSTKNKNGNKSNKIKKETVKVCVDDPFALEWPSVNEESYNEILKALKMSLKELKFNGLKDISAKHDDTNKKLNIMKHISKFVIFGYNAVMRNLEKNTLGCIFVDNNTKPQSLIKTFIPVCKLKSVPVIPLNGMETLLRKCCITKTIALGLTKDACKENGPFFNLHICVSKAFGNNSNHREPQAMETIDNNLKTNPSIVNIESLHLKRIDRFSRVFRPKKKKENSQVCDDSFIKIGSHNEHTKMTVNKKERTKVQPTLSRAVEESCSFFIDCEIDLQPEESMMSVSPRTKSQGVESLAVNEFRDSVISQTQGVKRNIDYIPTKIKRIKSKAKKKKGSLKGYND